MPAFWWRANVAVRWSPLVVLLASLGWGAVPVEGSYALAATATGASSIFVVGPLCAAFASWEAGRIRRSSLLAVPPARHPLTIASASLLPVVTVGVIALSIAIALRFVTFGVASPPSLEVLATAAAVLLGLCALGYGVGSSVSPVVAVPTTLLATYAWMVVPPALQPLWLRHLNGSWVTCCPVAGDIAPGAVGGATIVALGFGLAGALLVSRPLTRVRVAAAVVLPALGVGIGSLAVNDLGALPVVPRDVVQDCSSTEPAVCVYPEHGHRLEVVSDVARTAAPRWQALGAVVPASFEERLGGRLKPGFYVAAEADQDDLVSSLVTELLPPLPDCKGGGMSAASALAPLNSVLAIAGGMSADAAALRYGEEASAVATEVLDAPPPARRSWVQTNVDAVGRCDGTPVLTPPA